MLFLYHFILFTKSPMLANTLQLSPIFSSFLLHYGLISNFLLAFDWPGCISTVEGALWSVTHKNALCVSLRSNKHVECISFLTKHLLSQFLSIFLFKHCSHPCLLACGLLLHCLRWCIAAYLGPVLPPVDQWNSATPLVRLYRVTR